MRPAPEVMSDTHLLDEYVVVYRDGGRRRAEIRAQLESRLAACDALRAEVERLRAQLHADDQRAWEALGKPEGTYDTTNVQRICKEVSLLRTSWERVAHALLAKHKETP